MHDDNRLEHTLYGVCLVVAPLLLVASTLRWNGPSNGLSGGVLTIYSFTFFIGVVLALTERLRRRMPRLALAAASAGVLGCVGASNFGVEGIVEGALGITDLTGTILATAGAAENAAVVLAFFLPGILFPLTLLIVAAALIRAQEIPLWCGALLAAGALAFPLGRIPRIQEIALAADMLLLIPLLWLGSLYLRLWTADVTVRRMVDTGTGR